MAAAFMGSVDWFSPLLRKHMGSATHAAKTYSQVPLSFVKAKTRRLEFEKLARKHDELRGRFSTCDPEVQVRRNGVKSGEGVYDYKRVLKSYDADGGLSETIQRVEVKSSQLSFEPSNRRWRLTFANIKLAGGIVRVVLRHIRRNGGIGQRQQPRSTWMWCSMRSPPIDPW